MAGTLGATQRLRLTPELALVDHELREEARAMLPASDDTLARVELLVRAHRITASRKSRSRRPPWRRQRPRGADHLDLRARLEQYVRGSV
jgi:hypothetical protein